MASSTSFTEGGQGGGGDVNDPFYLVREEISDSVSTCESSFSRMHNLQTNQQQKKDICVNISSEIDSLLWQLNELDRATEAAERDPNRFRVSREELERRKAWTSQTRERLNVLKGRVENATMNSSNSLNSEQNRVKSVLDQNRNTIDDYMLSDERATQDQLFANQDEQLEDLSHHIRTIGNVGKTIGEELEQQGRMLEDLEEETEGVRARMQAANQMMIHVFKKAGVRAQLCTVFALTIILVLLFMVAFGSV
tara:strand:+ start:264 stop:1019 length:756 start_codon:yes stop_codon:yes gene_type:complete